MAMNPTHGSPCLTEGEIDHFHHQGYVGPFAAVSPDRMEPIREQIESQIVTTAGPGRTPMQARHQDHRLVYDLATHPAIVGRIRSLIGEDLMLWATYFFTKDPGGAEIPWHQDANYWPIEPAINFSVWMAIDRVTIENSCVNIIPGSHRAVIPHIRASQDKAFSEEADPAYFDAAKAVPIELEPGEFFLFTEKLLHQSNANTSNMRRMGMAMRFTLPWVKILDPQKPPLFPGHTCMMVSGEDRFGFNRMSVPPEA